MTSEEGESLHFSERKRPDSAESFLHGIESTLELPADIEPADAVSAVLCILTQRLSGGEARHIRDANLPIFQSLLRTCPSHGEMPEVFGVEEFLKRVGDHLHIDRDTAESVTRKIFGAVKAYLPSQEIQHVISQLPRDLQEVWLEPSVPAEAVSPESPAAEIIKEVENRKVLPPGTDPVRAVRAVLCVLTQRLTGGEARRVFDAMPGVFHSLLRTCIFHGESPYTFGREEFMHRVGEHLNMDRNAAEPVTRAVWGVIKQYLPPKEVDDIMSQLPQDLKDLWIDA